MASWDKVLVVGREVIMCRIDGRAGERLYTPASAEDDPFLLFAFNRCNHLCVINTGLSRTAIVTTQIREE